MRNTPFPADTVATVADLIASPWREALPPDDVPSRSRSLWDALSRLMREALDANRFAEAKVLWLLADAMSMMLTPDSLNTPFAPMVQWNDGSRSAIPEDFPAEDLNLLAEFIPHLDDATVRARVADLAWVQRRPRDFGHALAAIASYRALPLVEETWAGDGYESWTRALVLAAQLRKVAEHQIEQIAQELLAKFDADSSEGFFLLKVSQLLRRCLGSDKDASNIIDKLTSRARARAAEGNHYAARSYLEEAAEWARSRDDRGLVWSLRSEIADNWLTEAQARATAGANVVASKFIEKAIQTLREIPNKFRAAHDVEQRLAMLRAELDRAGHASVDEMVTISGPPIDLSSSVEASMDAIAGKPIFEALKVLAGISSVAKRDQMLETARRLLREHPLQSLFGVTQISRDGRTIGRRPALSLNSDESEEATKAIYGAAVSHFQLHVNLTVQAQIAPALHVFQREHRITLGDMVAITRGSVIVASDRHVSIARGLYAGFEGDFLAATYLLIPQLEYLVRLHLKSADAVTTNLSREGIEGETGLSNLITFPEMNTIFGDDLTFTFDALFCHVEGPNLRNEAAHGILDDRGAQSMSAVYAWWLMFKLVLNGFVAAQTPPPSSSSGPAAV